jgi:hypothetical protein
MFMARKKKSKDDIYPEVVSEVIDDSIGTEADEAIVAPIDDSIGTEADEAIVAPIDEVIELLTDTEISEEIELPTDDCVTYTTNSIKTIFNDIAKKENAIFTPYEVYRQKTPVVIKGMKGEPIKVSGFMTKYEPTVLIIFSDNTFIRVTSNHMVSVKGKNTSVEDLSVGNVVDTITGHKTITVLKASDKKQLVYELQVPINDWFSTDVAGDYKIEVKVG